MGAGWQKGVIVTVSTRARLIFMSAEVRVETGWKQLTFTEHDQFPNPHGELTQVEL